MSPVFLDTSYLIALEASDDQHHEEATRHWREMGPTLSAIVTTTYVFDEVVTFFNYRGLHDKAVGIGRRCARAGSLRLSPKQSRSSKPGGSAFRSVRTSGIR